MIDGNPNDFLEIVYNGEDIPYIYNNKKYWYQGYGKNGKFHMEIMQIYPKFKCVWTFEAADCEIGTREFQKAPIFEGKTFWEAEKDIQWLDC